MYFTETTIGAPALPDASCAAVPTATAETKAGLFSKRCISTVLRPGFSGSCVSITAMV